MATTDNKLINGSGLSELSSQIKSYVNNKSEIAIGTTAPTDTNIKIWVDTSIAETPATSISWDNITNKPTIPSIEGLASETYVDEKVAAIVIPEVPIKVSELENDAGYLTEHQSLEGYAKTADLAQVAKTGSYNDLIDKPTIPSTTGLASTKYVDDKVAEIVIPTVPTKVSAFENDKGYLTSHQSLADYSTTAQVQAMISSAIGAITNGNEVSY